MLGGNRKIQSGWAISGLEKLEGLGLSKDLDAFAGLLFEIGAGRLVVSGNVDTVPQKEKEKAEKAAHKRHEEVVAEAHEESEHTRIQYLLIKIGRVLNHDVFVARNDRHRSCDGLCKFGEDHTVLRKLAKTWPSLSSHRRFAQGPSD